MSRKQTAASAYSHLRSEMMDDLELQQPARRVRRTCIGIGIVIVCHHISQTAGYFTTYASATANVCPASRRPSRKCDPSRQSPSTWTVCRLGRKTCRTFGRPLWPAQCCRSQSLSAPLTRRTLPAGCSTSRRPPGISGRPTARGRPGRRAGQPF